MHNDYFIFIALAILIFSCQFSQPGPSFLLIFIGQLQSLNVETSFDIEITRHYDSVLSTLIFSALIHWDIICTYDIAMILSSIIDKLCQSLHQHKYIDV